MDGQNKAGKKTSGPTQSKRTMWTVRWWEAVGPVFYWPHGQWKKPKWLRPMSAPHHRASVIRGRFDSSFSLMSACAYRQRVKTAEGNVKKSMKIERHRKEATYGQILSYFSPVLNDASIASSAATAVAYRGKHRNQGSGFGNFFLLASTFLFGGRLLSRLNDIHRSSTYLLTEPFSVYITRYFRCKRQ